MRLRKNVDPQPESSQGDLLRQHVRALLADATQLDEQFDSTGDVSAARAAAQRWLDLADLVPQGDPMAAGAWHEAGVRYLNAYQHAEEPADLAAAQQLLADAVEGTPTDDPETRGVRLVNLGSAMRSVLERSEDLADVDRAQSVLEEAYDVLASSTPPTPLRATAGMVLAQVLRERHRLTGDMPSLERALALDEEALAAASNPEEQSQALNGLANSLAFRWDRRRDQRDLDRLVAAREQALETAISDSPSYVTALGNLANAYVDRAWATASDADFDRAVEASEEALSMTAAHSPFYPAALNNLAGNLRERYDHRSDVADAERALTLGAEALPLCREGSELWMSVATNYASGLKSRFLRQSTLDDLESAIDLLTAVATGTPPDAPDAVGRWHNLGNALRARFLCSRYVSDLQETVAAYEHAASLSDTSALSPGLLNDLGSAYNDRYDAGVPNPDGSPENDLDRARDCYLRAAQIAPEGTLHWRSARSNLGRVILTDRRRREDVEALDEAAAAFSSAIENAPPQTPEVLIYQLNLAETELLRYRVSQDQAALTRRSALLREVTEAGPDIAPDQGLLAASSWGRSALEREEWEEAAHAYRAGLSCLRLLRERQSRRDQKETWLHHAVTMAPRAAYSFARLEELTEAVAAAEAGRGVLLVEALEQPGAAGPAGGGEIAAADVDEAVAAATASPANGAGSPAPPLVYVVSGPRDGRALLVGADGVLRAVVLPGFGEQEVGDRLRRYQAAYDRQHEDVEEWHRTLDEVTGWLWTAGMGDLCAALDSDRAVLIPTGALSLLPLHAAWRADGAGSGAADRRRYAMENLLLTYAPNAQMLQRSRDVPPASDSDGVLVVADPQPSRAPALPHAGDEGRRVRQQFGDGDVLSGPQATRQAVWDAMARWPVLHFACHAYADPIDPLMSSLVLANDEPIRVSDILHDTRLRPLLVVLSACETAVVGEDLPDEVVGLPTAFLHAGARGVVGTWWPVYDRSSAEVMERFHVELRQRLDDPAEALRRAQLEVRALPGFDHPVHWAGVSYMGA